MKAVQKMLCAMSLVAFSTVGLAADRAKPEEAVAMVKKAIAYIKANGKEKGLAEISNPNGQFRDRDLYVFVYDLNAKMLAHGANPRMIGKDVLEIKDADGKQFNKAYMEIAKAAGKGWVDYKWPNPSTGAIEAKAGYIERYEDIVVGSGVYK